MEDKIVIKYEAAGVDKILENLRLLTEALEKVAKIQREINNSPINLTVNTLDNQ